LKRYLTGRQLAGVVTILIVLGVVGATLVVPTDSDSTTTTTLPPEGTTSTDPPTTTTTKLDPDQLGPEARELYDRVQAGRAAGYHVRYQLSGTALPQTASAATLEIWRSGARIRQDTRLDGPDGTTHGANLGGPDGTVTCQEQPGLAMSCQQDSTEPFPADQDFLSTVLDRISEAQVTHRDDEVIGTQARCYELDASTDRRAELCLDGGGIPLVVDVAGLRAVALEASPTVDPAVFTPPAPVSGPSTEPSTEPSTDPSTDATG
jgi:hypothetical protein